jgi:hypothetical protein
MISRNLFLTAVALFACVGTLAAAQSPLDRSALATTIGNMMGLSPEGSKLWAVHAVSGSDHTRYNRSTELHRAMGEQLALDRPNHALLTRLSSEIVAEGARLERIEQKRLLRIASVSTVGRGS